MTNLAKQVSPFTIAEPQPTKLGKKSEEQEPREFLAGRAQILKAAEPKAAKGEMEGIDEPGETSLELDTSLEKYPELYAELEA